MFVKSICVFSLALVLADFSKGALALGGPPMLSAGASADSNDSAGGLDPEPQASVFLIGNSLTWDTVPSRLSGEVRWHVDCGKNLTYITENPNEPCVATSDLWPKTLVETQFDYVTVQPHYGTDLRQDIRAIEHWMELQPKAVFVIHTGWPKHEQLKDEAADTDPAGPLTHSRAYFDELLRRLRSAHPNREFRMTRAMDRIHRIAADIETGRGPFQSIDEIYRDAIHVTIPVGRYLMHNTMRQALGQSVSDQGFNDIPSAVKQYLDTILKQDESSQ